MRGDLAITKVSIASGGTTSEAVDVRGYALTGIELPTDFTGTAITFLAARTKDGTYRAVEDDAGDAVSVVVAQNTVAVLTSEYAPALSGLPFIKIVSGSAEGAAREVWLYLSATG